MNIEIYRNRLGMVLTLSLFVAGAVLCVSAQAQKRRPQPQPKFDPKPFDLSLDELPPNYLGHSFLQIYAALQSRGPLLKKGEYESTIDYKNRLARLSTWPIAGSLDSNSVVAFSLSPVKQKYDADLTALDLSLEFEGGYSGDLTVSWLHSQKFIGSYIGHNAFNRAVRVKAYRYNDYLLSVNKDSISNVPSFVSAQNAYATSIIIPPMEARILRSSVRAILVCKLRTDPVSSDESHSPATISEPYDEYTFTYTLGVIPLAIWFYDISTGRVLAKLEGPQHRAPSVRNLGCPPVILYKPEPKYTEEARKNQVTGTVILRVLFTEGGEVNVLSVVTELPHGLTERALEAAKGIRFSPVEVNGKRISCPGQLEYSFNLY